MDSKRIALMVIAVVAIGIFALPSTVSLFSGQHSWYDLGASIESASGRNNVPCEKCHADIADEMGGENGAHRNLTCAMCHRTPLNTIYNPTSGHYEPESSITYARGHYNIGSKVYDPTLGEEAHAASVVECMDCHGSKDKFHMTEREYVGWCYQTCHKSGTGSVVPGTDYKPDFIAGGFGLTPFNSDNGTKAAHKKFVLDAIENPLMEGANEACITCHTRIGVNITWTKNEYMEFTTIKDESGNWTIPGFTAGGTNITYVNSSNEWTNP
jgi:hypothetical protein